MYLPYLITIAFAALVTAAPASAASKKPYIAVSLFFHIAPPHHFHYEEPAPMELYHFVNFHQAKNVKKVDFDPTEYFNIPTGIDSVECTFYSDALGQHPLGSFTVNSPLVFDEPSIVGSGICYAKLPSEIST